MYSIVSNVIEATSFFNKDVCKSTIDHLYNNDNSIAKYELALIKFKELHVLEVFENKKFLGFMKVSFAKTSSKNIIIDGVAEKISENDILMIEN